MKRHIRGSPLSITAAFGMPRQISWKTGGHVNTQFLGDKMADKLDGTGEV